MADTNNDPVPQDTEDQNFIEWYIDPRSRKVSVDASFGTVPLHLSEYDDFNFLVRVRVGGATGADTLNLTNLQGFKFTMREKGRYTGAEMASGTAGAFDGNLKAYPMAVSLNSANLLAYFAALDAQAGGYETGGYDCAGAAATAAGTTTTYTTTGTATANTSQTTTENTAPGTAQPSDLASADVEFMAMFQWEQDGKRCSSQWFSLFVSRNVILVNGAPVTVPVVQPPVDWRFMAPLFSEGTPFNGEIFGYFKATLPLEVLGLQIAIQQPDNLPLRIQLTDKNGVSLGGGNNYFADVPANTSYLTFNFGAVLTLQAGDEIRATVLNYAGNSAAGVTVNLLCRQYINTMPSGPSGPPGLTAATLTLLSPDSQASVTVLGQTVNFYIPGPRKGDKGDTVNGTDGTTVSKVNVTMIPAGSTATADLVQTPNAAGNVKTLNLGIPYPAITTPPNRRYVSDAVAQVSYSPAAPVIASVTFTGRGLPADIKFGFGNQDNAPGAAQDMNLIFYYIYRNDLNDPIFSDSRYMTPGGLMYIGGSTWDDQTPPAAAGPVTYTLRLFGYNRDGHTLFPSGPRFGIAVSPYIKILEFGNPLQ